MNPTIYAAAPAAHPRRRLVRALALGATLLASGCASERGAREPWAYPGNPDTLVSPIAGLRFIGEQRIAWKQTYEGTTVGGLSGIDYDPRSDTWILESDDRSTINPARFYTARLRYDAGHFDAVSLSGVFFFKQADGSNYPNASSYPAQGGEIADIETVRFDPLDASIWYASEGDVKLGLNPFVRHARRDGVYLDTLPLPAMFKVAPKALARPASGIRDNLAFEGLSFAPDGQSMWVSTEAPLYQDGEPPGTLAGADTRITRYDRAGKVLNQIAYRLDALPRAPGAGKHADTGISEILNINEQQLLVIERAGVQGADGAWQNFIRLYQMDVRGATDVSQLPSLRGASYVPARKQLMLDLNLLGLPQLDNVEGIAWGPKLANGHDTLVLLSDDNFNRSEVTQFLLFEVMPRVERWHFKNPLARWFGKKAGGD